VQVYIKTLTQTFEVGSVAEQVLVGRW